MKVWDPRCTLSCCPTNKLASNKSLKNGHMWPWNSEKISIRQVESRCSFKCLIPSLYQRSNLLSIWKIFTWTPWQAGSLRNSWSAWVIPTDSKALILTLTLTKDWSHSSSYFIFSSQVAPEKDSLQLQEPSAFIESVNWGLQSNAEAE